MDDPIKELVTTYYESFNKKDWDSFMSTLTDDVEHYVNQGGCEVGKEAFKKFMEKMNVSYDEKVLDLLVFTSDCGTRASAEFYIEGKYLKTDEGLPEAKGQVYKLRCGAFFSIKDNKIARVTNYYNLNEWLSQVKK
ncbi:MAG: hypothetical protein S4CHLAM37_04730 [Chlamydiia bacterium]|nr:hypothetical protein [Chlamydiia bacterium]